MKNRCVIQKEKLVTPLIMRAVILLSLNVGFVLGGFGLKWSWEDVYGEVNYYPSSKGVDVNGDSLPDILVMPNWDYADSIIQFYSGVNGQLLWEIHLTPYKCYHAAGVIGIRWGNVDPDPNEELIVNARNVDSMMLRIYDCNTHNLEYEARRLYGWEITGLLDVDGDNLADICVSGYAGPGVWVYGWTGPGVEEQNRNRASNNPILPAPVPSNKPIRFTIPMDVVKKNKEVSIVDVTGRVVRRIKFPDATSGFSETELWWDCLDEESKPVPSGEYFYRCGSYSGKIEVVR